MTEATVPIRKVDINDLVGWGLPVVGVYSDTWTGVIEDTFRNALTLAIETVGREISREFPGIYARPMIMSGAGVLDKYARVVREIERASVLILDLSVPDTILISLAGLARSKEIPVLVLRGSQASSDGRVAMPDWFSTSSPIEYRSMMDLSKTDGELCQSLRNTFRVSRAPSGLVRSLWFPDNVSAIWVVCPQCDDPGEYADRRSPDYTYLDNLGDTDALLEVMVFLSRYYPKAAIEKFSSLDLPTGHQRDNLVIVGGPGAEGSICNAICKRMMDAIGARVSYGDDCETMSVRFRPDQPRVLRAKLGSKDGSMDSNSTFGMLKDYGYFARTANPLNEDSAIVLVNGIHTAGVRGSARAFGDTREALRNYYTVLAKTGNAESFECYFEVDVLNGELRVPRILVENILPIDQSNATEVTSHHPSETFDTNDKLVPQEHPTITEKTRKALRVLFLASEPNNVSNESRLRLGEELRTIKEHLRAIDAANAIVFDSEYAVRIQDLQTCLIRYKPDVVHFSGHGSPSGELEFEGVTGESRLASQRAVTEIFRILGQNIRCIVLNACYSSEQAEMLAQYVDFVVGMNSEIEDDSAIGFASGFYQALANGSTVQDAFDLAKAQAGLETESAQDVPILHSLRADPCNVRLLKLNPLPSYED